LQQVVSPGASEGFEELRIPRGPQKCVGSDQRTCADARHDVECRSGTGAGEASDGASAERATGAAARECEDAERFSGAQSAELFGDFRGG
jgi:hypothetical protein